MVIAGCINGHFWAFIFWCDQSAVPEVDLRCADIKEKNEKSSSSVRIINNLLEIHYKILNNVKYNLAPLFDHLLKAPYENFFRWWFCLFLDPRYVADMKEIKELHGVEGVHNKTVIF